MSLPVRCWSRVRIGPRWYWRGCKAVLIGSEWVFQRPGLEAQDGATCPVCGALIEDEQKRAQVRGEKAVARRVGRGFGRGEGDAFR